MGTINYKTSEYITLTIKPYDFYDQKEALIDDYISEYYASRQEAENKINDDFVYDRICDYYAADSDNAQIILDKNQLWYFNMRVEMGYYEGVQVLIENNYPVCFDNYQEKQEAQKEITKIKSILEYLAGCGYVSTSCGWCMGYKDYKGTLKDIRAAVREMRQEVRTTPTERDYNANRHYKYM